MIDLHVHSDCSGDCAAPMMDVCRSAIDRGIRTICFTEHIDFEPTDSCFGQFDYSLYKARIAEARKAFGGDLEILCGVEVDYQDKFRSEIEDFLSATEFDYVLGAAHYVGGTILEDHERYFPGKTPREAYEPYFANSLATVRTGLFDTLAHMDLCKRNGVRYFGKFDWQAFREPIEQILREVIRQEMALEINTSGLRQAPGDFYPSREVLELYFSLGGRQITVGSDAHKVTDVGSGVAEAMTTARDVGFDNLVAFRERQRLSMPISEPPR